MEMSLPGEAVAELERNVRIADGVFKFITVKLADTPVETTEEA
jgi:small subunit ribosomal protein S6